MNLFPRPFALLCLLVFTACSSSPPPVSPPIAFTRYQPIYMDVSRLDVTDEYQSPGRLPNIEHQMTITPADAMHLWVKDRLRAVGADKTLQVIIKDAHVTVGDLPPPQGMSGWFADKEQRYEARLEVELRVYGSGALSEANANVIATRGVTIPARADANARELGLRRLLFELMETMNAELERNMFRHLAGSINYSHNP